jgi:exopolysaccharide biosynthesis polyprenyl glycosylphosphotransferase
LWLKAYSLWLPMFRRRDVRAYTVIFTALSDLLAVCTAFFLSWKFCFKVGLIRKTFAHFGIDLFQDKPNIDNYVVMLTFWILILLLVFHLLRLYNIRMPLPFFTEAARVTQGMFISLAVLFALSFFLQTQLFFSRGFVVLLVLSAWCLLLVFRNVLRKAWGKFLREHNLLQRVVLIGWGDNSGELVRHISSDVNSGREVVGVLSEKLPDDLPSGIQYLGNPLDLEKILEKNELDEVILGTLQVPHVQISDWILACERSLVQFRLIPDLFEILASRVELDFISGVPLLGIGEFPLERPFNRVVKRIEDIIGSMIGLILSAPAIIIGAILIRIESPGPIFYMQERCGRDGKSFQMFKLRTMKPDAEKTTGPVWAAKDDQRRTKIGTFLRKYNLDETPQFWNVLKGEMSLVGPRPERPFFVEQFKDQIKHYMPRHSFKPGMTGWAQVNGLRGNTPLDERVRYDLYYFESWSLWFDIRIMIATVFSFKNAY